MIPNVYVVGFTKCATTSLYEAIKNKPKQVTVCPTHKENTWFLKDAHLGKDYLDSLYPNPMLNDVCVDFHPNNAIVPYVPLRIKEVCPEAKVIMIIREPIARAYSEIMHFHTMRIGRELEPHAAMEMNLRDIEFFKYDTEREYMLQIDPRGGFYDRRYFERGCYHHYIKMYQNAGLEPKVFFFEDIIRGGSALQELADYIGVDSIDLPKVNSKSGSGSFDDNVVGCLREVYKPHNDVLSELLNVDVERKWYS
ncbi:hypothetical protein S1R3Y_000033 [Vibrio phage vB_ValP_VA-RY-3]|nr:hypothetical protein S1R3Y_000033 [Vibrio phage vB_ValP_VA-RY-3]